MKKEKAKEKERQPRVYGQTWQAVQAARAGGQAGSEPCVRVEKGWVLSLSVSLSLSGGVRVWFLGPSCTRGSGYKHPAQVS